MGEIMENCRICGKTLCEGSLMDFSSQPSSAQALPEKGKPDKGVDFSVKRCASCGVVQLDLPPVPYYREVIRTAGLSEEMRIFRLAQFSSFIEKYSLQGKKILECGCGEGEYLAIMKECGLLPYGMDGSIKNVEKSRNKGLEAEKLYFDTGTEKCKNGPFDAFYILNFLEHIPDIPAYLKGIYGNLNEEAVGLVEVPDFGMMLKNDFFAEFIPDHLYYFTAESLRNILHENGFLVLHTENTFHSYILSMQVKKMTQEERNSFIPVKKSYEKPDLSGMKKAKEKFVKDCMEILSSGDRCAVWGASHQTFSVLGFLQEYDKALLQKKLLFVADSAPFKQGKLTPATHFDIVTPGKIMEEKIDTLLIIAGGYSEEIARIAREKMAFSGRMYILRATGLEKIR